jgi:hypothetical protein
MSTLTSELKESAQPIVIRTERSWYILWGAIAFGVTTIGLIQLAAVPFAENLSRWAVFALNLLTWSIVFSWFMTYKICIDRNVLSYTELFKGTASVRIDEISNVELPHGRFKHAIVIKRQIGDPIVINTKPFGKIGIQVVFGFLDNASNSPTVTIPRQ